MPTLYISPSSLETVPVLTGGGSEAYQMHLLADALEPYLLSSGIEYEIARPELTPEARVRQANEGCYALYLTLRAAPFGGGRDRGITALYAPSDSRGQEAAKWLAGAFREIYPLPSLVTTRPATGSLELSGPKAPAALLALGYHDSFPDAVWLEAHRDLAAQAIAVALTGFLGVPFVYPQKPRWGTVSTPGGTGLPLRERPCKEADMIRLLPEGSTVLICGRYQAWYVVHSGDAIGYAAAAYILV